MMPLLFFLFALLSTVQSFVPPSCTVRSPTCLADMPSNLKIIFSDVDGALIHYPKKNEDYELSSATDDNRILALPPSATGMRGIVSSKTLAACRDLRQAGTLLVLVSGMRTSTLLSRLPYLPVADAYCTEAGGRIFYPSEPLEDDDVFDGEEDDDETDSPFPFQQATPLEFSGSQAADLKAFGLREDVDWRNRMEEAAGKDGYPGNEVSSNRCDSLDDLDDECIIDYDNQYGFPKPKEVVPIDERRGALWDYAQKLQHDEGLILDTKSYSTCFRVNRKHQTAGPEKFEALLSGDIVLPPELAKSTNLGCIDIYPISSGKRNCCKYIADQLGFDIGSESVCICDDDNDIEMALACSHAFIPALTSESVVETMKKNPTKFTQTYQQDVVTSTLATEAALQLICDGVSVA